MANILIVGGTGSVGIETTKALLEQGDHKIVCLSRGLTAHADNPSITFHKGDILDLDSLTQALEKFEITHVLHAAALRTSDCKAQPHRAVEINVTGTANLLEAIRQYGQVQRFVFISTAAIYKVPEDGSFVTEDSPSTPINAYTATKIAAEQLVECYASNYEIASTILRPQIIYGLSRGSEGSTAGVSTAIRTASSHTPFTIPFGGSTGFHYAPDIGKNVALALTENSPHFASYNPPCEPLALTNICDAINTAMDAELITHTETIYPFPPGSCDQAFKKDFPNYAFTPFAEALPSMLGQLKSEGRD